MKGLVVGGGSIGKRHLQNLKTLGIVELALVEPDTGRRQMILSETGTPGYASLDEGLRWSPDFVVIATPTSLHASQAMMTARQGIPFFVEKPLCHSPETLDDLCDLVARLKLVTLVGCNMRFHPGPAKVKELIDQGSLGRLLFARLQVGSYLPSWRPTTDYRHNYAAREETGGGCLLDCIHEVDLARWYMGDVQDVFCFADHLSSLQIETEDVAAVLCRHSNGSLSEIHLDYVQRTYQRGCQVVGDLGSIFWDFNLNQVTHHDGVTGETSLFPAPAGWTLNQMYLDEMRHFLDCLRSVRPSVFPVSDAASVMQIVFAAKRSAVEGRKIPAAREVLV
jgi:predicted dehydrogenase